MADTLDCNLYTLKPYNWSRWSSEILNPTNYTNNLANERRCSIAHYLMYKVIIEQTLICLWN